MYRRLCLKLNKGALTISVRPFKFVFVVTRLKQFSLGRKIKLETDHRPMEYIFPPNKELTKTVSVKITRWAISFLAFNYEINYNEGSLIPHADAMGRVKFDQDDDECNLVDY